MLKISTKGRYGLRLMFDLALHYTDGLVPLKVIAKRQEISEKYLEQIVIKLNHSNLLKSVRGAQGGYVLARRPKEITVGEVLRTLEGSITPTECVENPESCDKVNDCMTHIVWEKIYKAVTDVVDNINLEDLLNEYSKKGQLNYVI